MTGWYRADVGRHTHRKVRRLARELGVHTMHAVGIHDSLCAMVAEADADDGALGSITADDIAAEVEWEGEPARLFEALLRAGIIDVTPGGSMLHGFSGRNGARITKERKEREGLRAVGKKTLVYLALCPESGTLKIGESRDPVIRVARLRAEMPPGFGLVLITSQEGRDRPLHDAFATHRVAADCFPARSEWYTNEPEIWRAFGLEAP